MKAGRNIAIVLLLAVCCSATLLSDQTPVPLVYPERWPAPVYEGMPTRGGVKLGHKLFYDPILSQDNTISCGSCHLSYTAFTHVDHALSHGIRDSMGTRNSPALINLAWSKHFMWDGAVNHLDMQALTPINHPAEMGESTAHVVAKLQRSLAYRSLFHDAFGDSTVTGEHLLKALTQFEVTLISAGSKYDRVTAERTAETFTEQEANGYRSFQAHCNSCHREPLFTTGGFANNGLPLDSTLNDLGRMRITQDPKDAQLFKIPTLRNIEFSFPYMHDGRFRNLRAVLDHYDHGIVGSPTLAPVLQKGIPLTSDERTDLVAFLLTLSDRTFLFDRAHAPIKP